MTKYQIIEWKKEAIMNDNLDYDEAVELTKEFNDHFKRKGTLYTIENMD